MANCGQTDEPNLMELNQRAKEMVEKALEGNATPALFSLLRALLGVYEHALHFPNTDEQAFVELALEMWRGAKADSNSDEVERREVPYSKLGIARNVAAHLALFGKRKGLLPDGTPVSP